MKKRYTAVLIAIMLLGMILGIGLNAYASTYLNWSGEYDESHADTWVLFRNLWKTGFNYMGFTGDSYFAPSLAAIKNRLFSIDVYACTAHCSAPYRMLINFVDDSPPNWCDRDNMLKCYPLLPDCDDVYEVMNWRSQPLEFAFLGGCQAMDDTGYPSFADAFTKGGQPGSVVVGWKGLTNADPEWWYSIQLYFWEQTFINYLALGFPVRQALFSADHDYPTAAPYSCMFGDGHVNLNGVNHDTPGLTCGMGSSLYWNLNFDNNSYSEAQVKYGSADDKPVVGDWDGDGWDEIGVFRNGDWYLTENMASTTIHFWWGRAGDIAIAGDWSGNDVDTWGIHRNGDWYLDEDGGAPNTTKHFHWGKAGDIPLIGDFNGDGSDTWGIFRGSTWYLDEDGGVPNTTKSFYWGRAGDMPVVGDWNGDGMDGIGIYRPSLSTWYLDYDNNGTTDESFIFTDCTTPLAPIAGFWQPPDGDDEMMAGGSSSSSVSCHECAAMDIQELKVYPNPVRHEAVTFQVIGQNIQSIEVKLFDLNGQLVWFSGRISGNQANWELITQEGEQVANGIYLYSVKAQGINNSIWTSKMRKLLVLK